MSGTGPWTDSGESWQPGLLLTLGLAPLPLAADPLWARAGLGLLAVLCLYLYLRHALGQAVLPARLHPAQAWAAGYFLLAAICPLWSVRPDAAVALLPVLLAAAAAFWLLSQAGAAALWRLVLLLAATGLVQGLLGIGVDLLTAIDFAGTGSIGYRGAFAALLLAAALAAAAGALAGPWPWRHWLWTVAVLDLGVVLASGSRLTQLLLLPALPALVLLWPRLQRHRAAVGLLLAGLAALGLAALLLLAKPAAARLDRVQFWPGELIPASGDASQSGRLDAWRAALAMVRERPLTGAGSGGFGRLYGLHQINWSLWLVDAHSTWFQTVADLGLPGLLSLIAAWGSVAWLALRRALRPDPARQPLLLAVALPAAALVLHGSADLDYNLPAVALWTWSLLGAVAAAALGPAPARLWPAPVARQAWLLRGVALPLAALAATYVLLGPAVAQGYVQSARQQLAAGDGAAAVTATESANWWQPTAAAWAWQGAALLRLAEAGGGEPFRRQAEAAVQRAIARDPYNPALYSQLAGVQESRGERTAALTARRQAIALAPYHPRFRVELARALAGGGDPQAALAVLDAMTAQWERYHFLAHELVPEEQKVDWDLHTRLLQAVVAAALGEGDRARAIAADLAARYPTDAAVARLRQELAPGAK